ncbi:MAG: hypothetical protein DMG11_33350 [Acidobacteria bacterium]|nr:MAG: hypothetical protein DMG11_33350 [Acidobacteriota bacterium]
MFGLAQLIFCQHIGARAMRQPNCRECLFHFRVDFASGFLDVFETSALEVVNSLKDGMANGAAVFTGLVFQHDEGAWNGNEIVWFRCHEDCKGREVRRGLQLASRPFQHELPKIDDLAVGRHHPEHISVVVAAEQGCRFQAVKLGCDSGDAALAFHFRYASGIWQAIRGTQLDPCSAALRARDCSRFSQNLSRESTFTMEVKKKRSQEKDPTKSHQLALEGCLAYCLPKTHRIHGPQNMGFMAVRVCLAIPL